MIFAFAQLCAFLLLSRSGKWLLLPLSLLFLPIYDLTMKSGSSFWEVAEECAKETFTKEAYRKGQTYEDGTEKNKQCIERKSGSPKNGAQVKK